MIRIFNEIPAKKKLDFINKEKGGIKWYKHVEKHYGVQAIIDKAIEYHKQFPKTWDTGGKPWSNIDWAFGNAFRDLYDEMETKLRNNGQSSFNLDEVLNDEQIDYIAKSCNINIPYVETWKRD